jgi:hypothetical protein
VRLSSHASVSLWQSDSREFVASRSTASTDNASKESSHTHANQMIDMSGAVVPMVRNQRCRTSARSTSIAAGVRLARLCVLIFETQSCPAPGPPGPRRILRLLRCHPSARPESCRDQKTAAFHGCQRRRHRFRCCKYLQSLLLWSGNPAIPKRVEPLQSCLQASAAFATLAIGAPLGKTFRFCLVHEPAHADVHHHTQRQEGKQHRGPAVTH